MFITFEGGEGSGKTTQIERLDAEFKRRGISVVKTREPGGTPLGEHIRDCLLNPDFGISFGSTAELMLFLASRVQHIEEVIKPALSDGKTVLCDRFNDSSVAYQGGARGLGIDRVEELCSLACGGLEPDLTIYLDIAPNEGMARLQRTMDRLENAGSAFHEEVRKAFLELATRHPKRIIVIDATQSPDQVSAEILQAVDRI